MDSSPLPYKVIERRSSTALVVINVLGALATFFYFNVVAPLPEGKAIVQSVRWTDFLFVAILVIVPLTAGFMLTRKREAQVSAWHLRLCAGAAASEVPESVRRYVLSMPLRSLASNMTAWILVGAAACLASRTWRPFFGFVGVGGLLSSVLVFLALELLWRPVVPVFFPEGHLGAVQAPRLPVLGRLLIVFLLIGLLPPALLVNLSWQRAQTLLTVSNPQAVLSNMLILQLFVLITGVLASIALAVLVTRTITGPLDTLQSAMQRVERSDLTVRVPVMSNDELGYLGEGLNEMVEGLRERERIQEAHRKVEQELAIAWTIQQSFLPKGVPWLPGWQLAATLEPARQTSGDFYDFIQLPGGHQGILVADVADKGTGAALYMALSRTLIRTYAVEHHTRPEVALAAANRRIKQDSEADLFVTVFYGILDPHSGVLAYCNAGHNPALQLPAQGDGQMQELSNTGLPLGILEDGLWQAGTVQMGPGDLLVLYSDGITEAQDVDGALFGKERLIQAILGGPPRSAAGIRDTVLDRVGDFVGDADQFDDMTLLVVVRGEAEVS